jgi:hypothetical protein
VAFLNQAAGVNEFFKGESYSCGAGPGLIKDPTQIVTYGWEIYSQRTELLNDHGTIKVAQDATTIGGFIDRGSLGTVAADDPFVLTAAEEKQLAHSQRRLELNGANNTETLTVTSGTCDTNTGFQVGLDVGSDVVCEKLKCCLGVDNNDPWYNNFEMELYSATAASGPTSWSLRAGYRADTDHPEWMISVDAFHDDFGGNRDFSDSRNEIIIDLAALAANAELSSPASNTAMRYWKIVFKAFASSTNVNPAMVGMVAYDASGDPIGIPVDRRLGIAEDTNYLANTVVRATWRQDHDQSGTNGTLSSSGVTFTLSGGTFAADIADGDFVRELDGGDNVVQEVEVSSRDTPTQLTAKTTPGTAFSAEANWEVVRNADFRPRDDEGDTEDQARFPTAVGEVYICPVTGHIAYSAADIGTSRELQVEEHIKVKRTL